MWNDRYNLPGWAYGTEPNDFLRANASRIPMGKVLCLAEGEGRNAVFLAEQGFRVTGVDSSDVGLKKAQQFATDRAVTIETIHSDLADYSLGVNQWDGIVSIFCHLPRALRRQVYGDAVKALRPGGVLVLEAYSPDQLNYGTGGPPMLEMLYSLSEMKTLFVGLDLELAQDVVRDVQEGDYHSGDSSVVQVVACKAA